MMMPGAAWVSGPSATVWLRVPRDALSDFSPVNTYMADDSYAYLSHGDGNRFIEDRGLDAGLVPDAYNRLPQHLKETPA